MEVTQWYEAAFVEFFSDKPATKQIMHFLRGDETRYLCGRTRYNPTRMIVQTPGEDVEVCPLCKKLNEFNLTFVCNRAGQERRYGDTRYDFTITAHGYIPSDAVVYAIAQMIHKAIPKENAHSLVDSVLNFEQVMPGTWKYITGHAYTD